MGLLKRAYIIFYNIYFYPYKLTLSICILFYFFKVFKKDIEYNQSKDNVFSYFSTYFYNILEFTDNLSKRLFILKYIFSFLLWATIIYVIYN